MKRKIISIILSCTLILSLSACGKKAEDTTAENTQTAVNVTVDTATMHEISSGVSYTGEIVPATEVSVSPKTSGKVTAVNVEVGSYVNAGDVLFTIDDTDLKLAYNQALASYNSAVAGYSSVTGGSAKQSENQVNQAVTNAQVSYDSALTTLDREQKLYENNSAVILAQQAYDDTVASYNRALDLYNNDVNLIAARNALQTAKDNYDRMQSLFEVGAISQVDLDSAKTAYENAQASVTSAESSNQTQIEAAKTAMVNAEENLKSTKVNARASLDAAENAVKTAETALKNAKETRDLTVNVLNPQSENTAHASVQSAKAALDIASNNLNNTKVTAPISGYITSRSVEKGQNAAQGSPAIGLVNMNTVDVSISVTESVIPTISQGMKATVSVPSANISEIEGAVVEVSPTKDAQTGLFTVKISVPNNDGALKGGMFADVKLITLNEQVLSVPAESITTDGADNYVYVNNNGTAEKKSVEVGDSDGTYTEILAGVSEGESVIVTGKEFITDDNNQVTVTNAQ